MLGGLGNGDRYPAGFHMPEEGNSSRRAGEPVALFAVLGLLLILLGFLGQLFNVDLALLLAVVLLIVWLAAFRPQILINFAVVHIPALWCILDVYLMENCEIYVSNLRVTSFHSGALYWLVVAEYVFILALCIFNRGQNNSMAPPSESDNRIIRYLQTPFFALLFVLLAISIIEACITGYYSAEYRTRFDYVNNAETLSLNFHRIFLLLMPAVVLYSATKDRLRLSVMYLVGYLALLVLTGNKFGPLLLAGNVFAVACLYSTARNSREIDFLSKRVMFLAMMALLIMLFYSLFQMSLEHHSFSLGLTQLGNRLMNGQGDVWWGVYAQCSQLAPHFDEIWDELAGLSQASGNQLQYDFAIYKMMNLIAPEDTLKNYAELGARFTMSTDASLYYYSGPMGLLFGKVAIAFLLSVVVRGLIKSCASHRFIEAFLFTMLLQYCLRIAGMSEFYLLLSDKFVLCTSMLLFLWLLRRGCSCDKRMLHPLSPVAGNFDLGSPAS